MKKSITSALFSALFIVAASAATYTWTGAVGTDFANAGNWLVDGDVPATAPANDDSVDGDSIILPATVTVNQPTLTADQAVRDLIIEGSGWTLTTGTFIFKIGPLNDGVTTTYTSGTSFIDGNLRVSTTDQPQICWNIAEGGTLRINGTIGRYGSGGGATRKVGDGVLEFNTGVSKINSLIIDGGTVRAIDGTGGLTSDQYSPTSVTINEGGTYDLNGNTIRMRNLNGLGRVIGSGATEGHFVPRYTADVIVSTYLSGNFKATYSTDGRTISPNSTNSYTGVTSIPDNFIITLKSDSPLGFSSPFGLSTEPITLGRGTGAGGGDGDKRTSVLTDGPYTVGQSINLGTDNYMHTLGATATQVGTSTFSGDIRVGAGAAYNGDNSNLYIVAGPDAVVNFTGSISNLLAKIGNVILVREGKVVMSGPGVARVSGDNTYTGGTIISNGTLIAASPTALSIGGATVAGGTLGGTATVLGAVTVESGASLTAGEIDDVGTLTLDGGLTLDSGSKLLIQVKAADADRVLLTDGAISVSSPVVVDVDVLAEAVEKTNFPILDWTASTPGTPPSIEDFAIGDGADQFGLKVLGNVLYLKPLGPNPTFIMIK